MAAVDMLEDAGFAVAQASTARDAIAKFSGGGFAAAIIDLGLPDRPGDHVAATLRAAAHDLPILIASGRSDAELQARFSGDARVALVGKPYSGAALIEALSTLGVQADKQ
jgi:DNA-binding response OmpR family regulator